MKRILPLVALPLLMLTSCGGDVSPSASSSSSISSDSPDVSSVSSSESSEKYTPLETTYSLSFESLLMVDEDGNKVDFQYDFEYKDAFFDKSGTTFQKDLALLSFASHISAHEKEGAVSFLEGIGFDNIVQSPDYDQEETKDTVLYNFAHRHLNGSELIAINMDSTGYTYPWISNATIGKEGNATGYQSGSDKVLAALKSYVAPYEGRTIKLWLSSYSRTAGITNILAQDLLDEKEAICSEENMYCYAFESPRVVEESLKKDHPSIHNIINRGDLFTYLFPEEYGFVRAGHDVDIYNENADELVLAFDEKLVLAPFTAKEEDEDGFMDEAEFDRLIVSILTQKSQYEESDVSYVPDLSTRDNYVDNGYQEVIAYLLAFGFSLKETTLKAIQERFENLTFMDVLLIAQENGLYNILSPILDEHGESYDPETLRTGLNKIVSHLMTNCLTLLPLLVDENYTNNAVRAFQFHAVETILPLLLAYEEAK